MATTQNLFNGNGSTTEFTYTFPTLKDADVKAEVDNALTTAFTLLTSPTRVKFNTAPASGTGNVRVFRDTDVDAAKAVFASGSSIKATDLNNNIDQLLYATQEEQGATITTHRIADNAITTGKIKDANVTTAKIAADAINGTKIADNAIDSEHYTDGSIDTAHIADSQVTTAKIADDAITVAKIADGQVTTAKLNVDAVTGAKLADNSVDSEHYVDGSIDEAHIADGQITTAKLNADAVTGAKIADDAINSEHYAAGSIDLEHMSANSVDSDQYVDGSIDTAHIADLQVTTAKLADSSVTGAKLAAGTIGTTDLADDAVTTAKLADGAVTTAKIADDAITAAKIADNVITASHIAPESIAGSEIATNSITASELADNAVDTAAIATHAVTTAKIAADAITTAKIADDAVTTAKIADAELTTLAGMQSGTASILADSTALTSTTAELNLLDGKSIVTTISASPTDVQIPTAQAVDERITTVVTDVGGFVPIANETSFPATNPDIDNGAGTIVSIKALASAITTGSGVTTKTIANGAGSGNTVTINGLTQNTTYPAGRGMLVETTSTLHTYTYHRLTLDESGVADAQAAIDDFDERYYGPASSAPTSKPGGGARADGDMYFDTTADKMKVWNNSATAWDDVATSASSFISTLSPAFDGSETEFTVSNEPVDAQSCIVSINGVIQKPNSGTSTPSEGFVQLANGKIKFATAPPTGSDYFVVTLGNVVSIGTPSPNTVGTTELENLGVTTAKIAADAVDGTKIADDAVGAEHIEVLDAALQFGDSVKAQLGAGNDLEIYHDGSHSRIKNTTGYLILQSSTGILLKNDTDDENFIVANDDGSVELCHDGTKKFETTSSGVGITGTLTRGNGTIDIYDSNTDTTISNGVTNGDIVFNAVVTGQGTVPVLRLGNGDASGSVLIPNDFGRLKIGAGADLQMYHDGSHSYVSHQGGTGGDLIIQTTGSDDDVFIKCNDDFIVNVQGGAENAIIARNSGAVELYYDANKRLETTSSGVNLGGNLSSDSGEHFVINAGGASGTAGNVILRCAGENSIVGNANGSVDLYHDNSKVAETWSGGLRLTGAIKAVNSTADSHWGTDSSTWSQFQTLTANNVAIFENSHDSTPYGNYLYFSDAAPDNNVQYYIQCDDNSASRIKMYADGDIWTSDAGTLTSDETLKENITDATSKLEDLKKLKVRNFYWKASFHPEKSKKKQLGFIAQEVETVFPNLIQEHDVAIGIPGDDHTPVMKKSIKQAWAPILVKALQEAVAKIETLETKVAALEAK